MGVRLLSETVEEDPQVTRLKLVAAADPHQRDEAPARPKPQPPSREDVMELMAMLARILGFRFQLLLAFLGAVGLGVYGAVSGSVAAGISAALYDLLIFLPVLFVALKRG